MLKALREKFGIKFMLVREKVQEFKTRIKHILTKSMIANPITKGLTIKFLVDLVTLWG